MFLSHVKIFGREGERQSLAETSSLTGSLNSDASGQNPSLAEMRFAGYLARLAYSQLPVHLVCIEC